MKGGDDARPVPWPPGIEQGAPLNIAGRIEEATAAVGLAGELATDYPGMHVALTDQAGGERLLGLLGGGNTALDRVYILDPMGNLMMRYAPDAPAKDTLNDMGRLIKASKNWIKGADYGHK